MHVRNEVRAALRHGEHAERPAAVCRHGAVDALVEVDVRRAVDEDVHGRTDAREVTPCEAHVVLVDVPGHCHHLAPKHCVEVVHLLLPPRGGLVRGEGRDVSA